MTTPVGGAQCNRSGAFSSDDHADAGLFQSVCSVGTGRGRGRSTRERRAIDSCICLGSH